MNQTISAGAEAAEPTSASTKPDSTLFYLVDWLPPAFGATGQYGLIFATDWAKTGRTVHLVGLTSGPPSVVTEQIGELGGSLTIHRLHAHAVEKSSYLARIIWAIATNLRIIARVLGQHGSSGSEIVFTGSPPFMLYFAVAAKYLRRARLQYRITDFYPEVVIAAAPRRAKVLEALQGLTWFMRRRVDHFQVLGEDQRQILLAGGIEPGRISLKRDHSPVVFTGRETPMAPPTGLTDKLVLLYSGNFGVAHDVGTTLEGLKIYAADPNGRFGLWINGSGASADHLAKELQAGNLPVARTPPLPLEQLASLLRAADVHLITLRPSFAGLVLPSKVYGCIDSGRPILFVGPTTSDVHLLCSALPADLYRRVEPGDSAGFASALAEFEMAATTAARPRFA